MCQLLLKLRAVEVAQIFDSLKIPNVSNLFFEKGAAKKHKFFIFLKGPLFRNGWPNFDRYFVNLNVKSKAKFNCL